MFRLQTANVSIENHVFRAAAASCHFTKSKKRHSIVHFIILHWTHCGYPRANSKNAPGRVWRIALFTFMIFCVCHSQRYFPHTHIRWTSQCLVVSSTSLFFTNSFNELTVAHTIVSVLTIFFSLCRRSTMPCCFVIINYDGDDGSGGSGGDGRRWQHLRRSCMKGLLWWKRIVCLTVV